MQHAIIAYLLQDFLPDIIGPMGGNRCEEERLQFDVTEHEVVVHADLSTSGSFTVEVSTTGEVVQGRFEGEFIVCSIHMLARLEFWSVSVLTLHSVSLLRAPNYSSRSRRACPKIHLAVLFAKTCL